MNKLLISGFVLVSIVSFAASAAAQRAARCLGSQLAVEAGEGDADMGGKRYGEFFLTNVSKIACTVSGFPAFAALNRAGRVLKAVPVAYTNDFPNSGLAENAHRQVITLNPGKKVRFQTYYNDGMALDQKRPFPVVSKVRINAPKDKKAFVLTNKFTVCCGISVGSISPVVDK